jgi:hypothetical protein
VTFFEIQPQLYPSWLDGSSIKVYL